MVPENPNFDPVVRTGWNQCHYKDNQILSPKTVHGLKLELEQQRYHKNQVSTSIDAPLTSRSHNIWFDHWIFEFYTFLETGSQDLSRGVKINPIQYHLKVAALEGPLPRKVWRGYKKPQAPPRPKERRNFLDLYSLPGCILHIFPLFQTQKTHQNLLIPLFTKNTRYYSYTHSSFPWFYTLGFGV